MLAKYLFIVICALPVTFSRHSDTVHMIRTIFNKPNLSAACKLSLKLLVDNLEEKPVKDNFAMQSKYLIQRIWHRIELSSSGLSVLNFVILEVKISNF